MERTIGMRIKECRIEKRLTQEAMAELMYTKKSTISDYENDRIDMKISVLKEIAKVLDTTVAYLSGEDDDKPTDEVMEMAKVLMSIKNEDLRKAAFAQVKILAGLELV